MRGSGTSYIMGKFLFPEAGRGNLHPQRPSALHGAGPRAMCSCVQAGPALLQLSPGLGIWVCPCSASALTSGCTALALTCAQGDREHFWGGRVRGRTRGAGTNERVLVPTDMRLWSHLLQLRANFCFCRSQLHFSFATPRAQSLGSRTIPERHPKGRVGASRAGASRA